MSFLFLNLNQTQKVKQHFNPPRSHTHTDPVSSREQRTSRCFFFFYFSVLLQRCWNSKPASLEWICFWSSPYESWLTEGSRGLMWGCCGNRRGRPYILLHCHIPFLWAFVNIVSTTSPIGLSHSCRRWQWGSRPPRFLLPPRVFFSSRILTSLPLLCCSHSFGGATLKGSYGQPCPTREQSGSGPEFGVCDSGSNCRATHAAVSD